MGCSAGLSVSTGLKVPAPTCKVTKAVSAHAALLAGVHRLVALQVFRSIIIVGLPPPLYDVRRQRNLAMLTQQRHYIFERELQRAFSLRPLGNNYRRQSTLPK